MVDLAVQLSTAAEAQGHRADIAILKTARAMAALLEKSEIEKGHLAEAARMVLPHRMAHAAMSTVASRQQKIEEIVAETLKGKAPDDDSASDADGEIDDWDEISTQVPGSWAASNTDMVFSFLEEKKKRFLTPTP